ncbi:MAG: cytochrome P450, partial [Actinomycetota bacterium]|nr:cytochrome P450 [Actinomycetota bacterium]
ARALSASVATIARHPDAAARVAADRDYAERAVLEALRLDPPTTTIVRVASARDELPSGTVVPPRAKLLVSPYLLHRDPGLHPDPERFDPGRFDYEARRERPPYAYIPFGAGPRTCIARNLALMAATLVVRRAFRA